jgi:hypothetical protein
MIRYVKVKNCIKAEILKKGSWVSSIRVAGERKTPATAYSFMEHPPGGHKILFSF